MTVAATIAGSRRRLFGALLGSIADVPLDARLSLRREDRDGLVDDSLPVQPDALATPPAAVRWLTRGTFGFGQCYAWPRAGAFFRFCPRCRAYERRVGGGQFAAGQLCTYQAQPVRAALAIVVALEWCTQRFLGQPFGTLEVAGIEREPGFETGDACARDCIVGMDSPPGNTTALGFACTVRHSGSFARSTSFRPCHSP